MRIKQIVAPMLLAALAGALLIQLPLAIAERSNAYEWFNPIIDVRSILLERYVADVDEQKMQQAMIEGMVDSLNDPYTEFIPFDRQDDLDRQLRGRYVGIGAEVNMVDGYLTIVSPMDDSPALEAGILAGDTVLEIEGESTYDLTIQECIDRLLGEPNTDVTIRVRHLNGEEQEITITRRQIVTRTVRGLIREGEEWNYCLDEDLGISYLRISQFNDQTANDLRDVLNTLKNRNMNGLVLDLRDNPGGSLGSAVQVADLFLDSGTIVSVRSRSGQDRAFNASRNGTLPPLPIVVIVNSASASASEIVAGALQDNSRAKVLGTRTFGKGSVQELRELPFKQGTIKYTTAHYHLPSGRNLNRMPDSKTWGVDPDPGFVVRMDDEAYLEMLRARREYEIISEPKNDQPECATPSWIREAIRDKQLALAVEAVQARLRGEEWPAVGDDEDPSILALDQELQRAAEQRSRLIERLRSIEDRMGELHTLAEGAGRPSLLPDDAEVLGGTMVLHDRHGNPIGRYRIEGGNLEVALTGVRLTREEEEDDDA